MKTHFYARNDNIPSHFIAGNANLKELTHRPNGTKYMSTREVYKAFGVDYDKEILGKEE